MGSKPIIQLDSLEKSFRIGSGELRVLQGITLDIHEKELVAVMGPSGSGKSTLLNIIGCLDRPTKGTYLLAGRDVSALRDSELSRIRNRMFGFVFQNFNLLPRYSALRNVEIPMVYRKRKGRRAIALDVLDFVGLRDRAGHLPSQLSGGEQQRVAIARALVNNPSIILADEPTGNLDSASGEKILALLEVLSQRGHTIIIVTHEEGIARRCQRIIRLHDGRVVADERVAASGVRKPPPSVVVSPASVRRGPGQHSSDAER